MTLSDTMKFSERIGKSPVRTALQVESIDKYLRNTLWNVLTESFFDKLDKELPKDDKDAIYRLIWKGFFYNTVDVIPKYPASFIISLGSVNGTMVVFDIRKWFFADKTEWFKIYDFIEFIAATCKNAYLHGFIGDINHVLKKELAGYRLVNGKIVQVTSEEEIQAIEDALVSTDIWKPVNTHLQTALDLLSDRKNPDYRNSIKESISAVEAICCIITGSSATLGQALKQVEKEHHIHSALSYNLYYILY